MKTVLIPTDFSKVAHEATRYALDCFEGDAINYVLLNAFKVESSETAGYQEVKTEHKQKLEEETAVLKKQVNAESDVSCRLWMGKINYLSQEVIDENDVDLVIMGTEGITELEEYVGKSNAGEFISHVDVNTLIVPSGASYNKPQNILFTTDYKNIKIEKALTGLREMVNKFNANLFVLYVNHEGAPLTSYQLEVKDKLRNSLEDCKVSFHEFVAEDIEAQIDDFMLQYNIDMVSAIPMHNNFFDRIFHKSLTRKLTQHATKPVLVLTNK